MYSKSFPAHLVSGVDTMITWQHETEKAPKEFIKEARQLSLYLKIAHGWGGWTIKHVVETWINTQY